MDGGRCISIHALREEGDRVPAMQELHHIAFLSTPSARRATKRIEFQCGLAYDFYPRPPRGGRRYVEESVFPCKGHFYPRPPRGGRHLAVRVMEIVEDFYPRPPRGGRPAPCCKGADQSQNFYPRPPRGGRHYSFVRARRTRGHFYPRPPRGGRPANATARDLTDGISIHALREEGDYMRMVKLLSNAVFLSTPSARRATRSSPRW